MSERKVTLQTEEGESVELLVIEQTMLGNVNYLLVTESDDDEADAYILKETGTDTEDAFYEFVEDDVELEAISRIFTEILEDEDIELIQL